MNQRTFSLAAGIIFLIVAVLDLLRIILGWQTIVGGWQVPEWISWMALVVAGFMAFEGLKLAKKGLRLVR